MSEYVIRQAVAEQYNDIRACMKEIFNEVQGLKSSYFDQELWEWQYLQGPRGSVVVVAEDQGKICGYYHCVLCDLSFHGRPVLGAMVQDVGTLKAYRRMGIFRDMGTKALDIFIDRGVEFIYTFPNARSMPSFVHNHSYDVVARIPVYLLLLNPVKALSTRLPSLGMFDGIGRMAGKVCCAFLGGSGAHPGDEIRKLSDADDFSVLDCGVTEEFALATPVCLRRSADYLDWRFNRHPKYDYSTYALFRGDELEAYLVLRRTELLGAPTVAVMDFGCRENREASLSRLLANRLAGERDDGMALAVVMGLHSFFARLVYKGFFRVPARFDPRPFNLLTKNLVNAQRSSLFARQSWFITLADWDVL